MKLARPSRSVETCEGCEMIGRGAQKVARRARGMCNEVNLVKGISHAHRGGAEGEGMDRGLAALRSA